MGSSFLDLPSHDRSTTRGNGNGGSSLLLLDARRVRLLLEFRGLPVEIDGKIWPTSEHYFQAQKFLDPESQEAIRRKSPMVARGWPEPKKPLRKDWNP